MRANRSVQHLFVATLCLLPSLAFADLPMPRLSDAPPLFLGEVEAPAMPKKVRLLNESLVAATAGVAVPLLTYVAITQTGRSFNAFFTGFSVATLLGAVGGPLAVSWAHGHLGGQGRWTRALTGALIGIAAGFLIGLPLSTLPNQGYHAGLGLLWGLPAACTVIALEW